MQIREALTFDDVLLQPARSAVLPSDVDTRTRLTRRIELGIPLLSAAMDSMTPSGKPMRPPCLAKPSGSKGMNEFTKPRSSCAPYRAWTP